MTYNNSLYNINIFDYSFCINKQLILVVQYDRFDAFAILVSKIA
jgi:hypothetical protein